MSILKFKKNVYHCELFLLIRIRNKVGEVSGYILKALGFKQYSQTWGALSIHWVGTRSCPDKDTHPNNALVHHDQWNKKVTTLSLICTSHFQARTSLWYSQQNIVNTLWSADYYYFLLCLSISTRHQRVCQASNKVDEGSSRECDQNKLTDWCRIRFYFNTLFVNSKINIIHIWSLCRLVTESRHTLFLFYETSS